MDKFTETLIFIDSEEIQKSQLVQIIEVAAHNLDIDTISGMANREGKSFNGIKTSDRYAKIKIGKAILAIKGVKQTKLPF